MSCYCDSPNCPQCYPDVVAILQGIEDFSIEELREEIKRREDLEKKKPELILDPDLKPLSKAIQNIVEIVDRNSTHSVDYKDRSEVFDLVLETFYGKGVWKWWDNKGTRGL